VTRCTLTKKENPGRKRLASGENPRTDTEPSRQTRHQRKKKKKKRKKNTQHRQRHKKKQKTPTKKKKTQPKKTFFFRIVTGLGDQFLSHDQVGGGVSLYFSREAPRTICACNHDLPKNGGIRGVGLNSVVLNDHKSVVLT